MPAGKMENPAAKQPARGEAAGKKFLKTPQDFF